MNIKTLLISIIPLLIASPVLAESKYPVIAGIEISETTTSAEYIAYAFSLLVAIGSFIAVVMVVIAAIEWMTSSGNPSKIESSKGKIKNAVVGVGVLLGSYIILSTINPEITTVKIDDLVCDYGIIMKAKLTEDGDEVIRCIDQNTANIDYSIVETVNKDAWNFDKGSLLAVFLFSGEDYTGTVQKLSFDDDEVPYGEISGAKSIYFLRYSPGVYIYDSTGYNIKDKKTPLYFTSSLSSLSSYDFDNTAESIETIHGDDGREHYSFVAFTSQNYEGVCDFSGDSVPSLSTMAVGLNGLSSIIIKKTTIDMDDDLFNKGYVTLYTKQSCGKTDSLGTSATEIKECKIYIPNSPAEYDIYSKCSNFNSGDAVLSFSIVGSAGIVLSTSELNNTSQDTRCKYFGLDSLGSGTCYNNLNNTSVYTIGGVKPKSIIIIPGDK